MKRSIKYIILLILFLYLLPGAGVLAKETVTEDKEYELRNYEEIKKEQNREFKKGYSENEETDYVKDWIGEDINYQKKVIKLKKEYIEWAKERLAGNGKVIFSEYEKIKKLNRVERQVLLDYHNRFFRVEEKEEAVALNIKKRKIVRKKTTEKTEDKTEINSPVIQAISEEPALVIKPETPASQPGNSNNKLKYLLIIAIILAAALCIMIVIRSILFFKSKSGKNFFLLNKNSNQ